MAFHNTLLASFTKQALVSNIFQIPSQNDQRFRLVMNTVFNYFMLYLLHNTSVEELYYRINHPNYYLSQCILEALPHLIWKR